MTEVVITGFGAFTPLDALDEDRGSAGQHQPA